MRKFLQFVSVIFAVSLLSAFALSAQDDLAGTPDEICDAVTPAEAPESRDYDGAEDVLEAGVDYRAIFCTGAGAVYVDLFEDQTPVTVNNFVFLAEDGYYNNTNFHRVIADFMAQGGDPTNTGSGGPGYQFQDEFVGYLRFDRTGLLAMANAGENTNGSQFFLTTAITSHLDFRHTIFGEVLVGQDVVENIELRDPSAASGPGTALETVVIIEDPSVVVAEFEVPEPADAEDFEAIIDELPALPGGVALTEATGVYETEDYVGTLAEGVSETASTLLSENNHQFTVVVGHDNTTCNLEEAPFGAIGYTIHAFETPADAAAALESESLLDVLTNGEAYETAESDLTPDLIYTRPSTTCDVDANDSFTYTQLGRFITVAQIIFPADSPFDADLWLTQIVKTNVYELLLAEALRPEVIQ